VTNPAKKENVVRFDPEALNKLSSIQFYSFVAPQGNICYKKCKYSNVQRPFRISDNAFGV
jgi:hypothetical protein